MYLVGSGYVPGKEWILPGCEIRIMLMECV